VGSLLAFVILMSLTTASPALATAEGDFVIRNGKLVAYNGPGGDVVIPSGVTIIGANAFENCEALTSVTIPDGVTDILLCAFSNCKSLTAVNIPDSVVRIQPNVFEHCEALKSITIPKNVTEIGGNLFSYCRSLKDVKILGNVKMIHDSTFYFCDSLENVSLPDSVMWIGSTAFWNCSSLKEVILPNRVVGIGMYAFNQCKSLESIAIPRKTIRIEGGAFANCPSLKAFKVYAFNLTYVSVDGVLFTADRKVLHSYPAGREGKSYDIPNRVVTIESKAFAGSVYLENINIPDSVTEIADYAFDECPNLTLYVAPGSAAEAYASQNGISFKVLDSLKGAASTGADGKIPPFLVWTFLILIIAGLSVGLLLLWRKGKAKKRAE
jgi:deoxycytidine triphosphate deaminase